MERIGSNAFWNCDVLEHIDLPAGLTEIGGRAFGACDALLEIVIPSGVTGLNETFMKNDTEKTT